ncbi:BRO family protein [Desulfovibrio sp. ZJ200]|uniref:BRO-N domain-containing protein n=1 Tax=Desulfovibrio sp. ZJ200 TaxID=2709792 RepID=UPI0013ED6861|nr:BRO family protein [Desulfovibrio sp. ZJ200]
MSNALMPFAFGDNLVRVINDENGNPWFVAKDVALALGYEWNGAARIAHVPDEWRGVTSVVTPRGGTQEMLTLSEQGMYFFLNRSDKPGALPFQKWLAGEVLPALRKTGRYETPHTTQENPTGPEEETFGDDRLFSPAVLQLESSQRIRLLEQATSMAKEEGWGVHEMEEYFVRLCTMTGKTKRDPKRERIQRFIAQCMTRIPGQNLPFMRVYAAFYEWWEANERGPVPGSKSLATELRRYFEPQKSNVSKYRDCALR